MNKTKIIFTLIIFSIFIISACAPTISVPVEKKPQGSTGVDVVREISIIKENDFEKDDEGLAENDIEEVVDEEEISPEIEELLSIADKKVDSLRYNYKGPETEDKFFDFYVKGNKVKYIIDPTYKIVDLEEDAYDTIYINKEFETALAYCDNKKCKKNGKKAVLDYDENNILTPFDWLDEIESAEIVGERLINRRNTMQLTTDKFTIWIDLFFGIPLQVETADNLYQFDKISFNNVKDEDVSIVS